MARRPLQSHANTRADWFFPTGVGIPGTTPQNVPSSLTVSVSPRWCRWSCGDIRQLSRRMGGRRDERQEQVRALFTSPFPLRKCSSVSCKSRRAGVKSNHDFSDSSYRRLAACRIRPPTEGGRAGSWNQSSTKGLASHTSMFGCGRFRLSNSKMQQLQEAATQETLANLVTLL